MNITLSRDARPTVADAPAVAKLFRGVFERLRSGRETWRNNSLPQAWRRAIAPLVVYFSRFDIVVMGNRNEMLDEYISVAAALAAVPVRLMELPLVSPAVTTLDGFIAPSAYVCEHSTVRRMALPCSAIAPGVDLGRWYHASTLGGRSPRPLQPPQQQGATIVFVGRLDPEKSPALFVRAASVVHQRYPSARFLVIGEGSLRASLTNLADELGMLGGNTLRFVGAQLEALPSMMSSAIALCMPSLWEETFGITNIEGMALGLPVISFALGGQAEYLRHGTNALIPSAPTVDALAHSMVTLLFNHSLARRLGSNGKRLVQRQFALGHMILQYEHLYMRLFSEARATSLSHAAERLAGASLSSHAALLRLLVERRSASSIFAHSALSRTDPIHYMRAPAREAYDLHQVHQFSLGNSTVTRPTPDFVARVLDRLLPYIAKPGARILEVGAGCGYVAAALARCAALVHQLHSSDPATVIATEHRRELLEHVRQSLLQNDGDLLEGGWLQLRFVHGDAFNHAHHDPDGALFDAIHVGTPLPSVPEALLQQLKPGGRMIVPVGPQGASQRLLQVDSCNCPAGEVMAPALCSAGRECHSVSVLGLLNEPAATGF